MKLALKQQVGLSDVVAALTAAAAAAAAIYNYGYFSVFNGSLISLLSFQDLLVSTAAALPFVVVVAVAGIMIQPIHHLGQNRYIRWLLLLCVAVFLAIGYYLSFSDSDRDGTITLVLLLIAGGVLAIIAPGHIPALAYIRTMLIIMILVTVPFVLGRLVCLTSLNILDNVASQITMDSGAVINGTILRQSATHTFIVESKQLTVLPITDIRSIAIGRKE